MYPSIRSATVTGLSGQPADVDPVTRPRIGRNVLYLGLTSLFTDISSEMVTSILPIYLVFALRFTPLEFGVIDGLY